MSVKQNTLKGEFSLKGKGLHTGKEVCVERVIHIAKGFKNGGFVVRLRKLIIYILKLNALGIPPVCKAANPVLIHSLKRYAVLRRMGLPVALCLSDKGIYLFSFLSGKFTLFVLGVFLFL